jgi:hypothetical protein
MVGASGSASGRQGRGGQWLNRVGRAGGWCVAPDATPPTQTCPNPLPQAANEREGSRCGSPRTLTRCLDDAVHIGHLVCPGSHPRGRHPAAQAARGTTVRGAEESTRQAALDVAYLHGRGARRKRNGACSGCRARRVWECYETQLRRRSMRCCACGCCQGSRCPGIVGSGWAPRTEFGRASCQRAWAWLRARRRQLAGAQRRQPPPAAPAGGAGRCRCGGA